jgi:pSer/pThr/pTyr-binding forkhead associated (FHA) protein
MNARLVLRSDSPQKPPLSFFIRAGTFILGRSSTCDLVVKDGTVSRRHAQIVMTPAVISVQDLDSRNGTFIGERKVTAGLIRKGEFVRFGKVQFAVASLEENAEASSEVETTNCKAAGSRPYADNSVLSKAQLRVLDLLLQGLAEKQVAAGLKISFATVHNHTKAIYRAFKVHSRSELLVLLLGRADT